MKINEAVDVINHNTEKVLAKTNGDSITFGRNGRHSYFVLMSTKARHWEDHIIEDWDYLYDVKPADLALVMDVIQRLLDTPVKERFPEKKYRLRWIDYLFSNDSYHNPIRQYLYKDGNNGWDLCDYKSIAYKSEKAVFTESKLEQIKRDAPCLATAIDAMKEPVEDIEHDND